ncbi:MAG: hypothetical protein P8008_02605 [Gammaproteobacteria bacterium]
MFHRGLSDFDALKNLEKTRFGVAMARLLNVYVSAVRTDAKSLINSQEVQIFGDICFAMINTPGGRQWWELTGPFFTIYDLMNERTQREGDTQPSWTDLLPYFQPDTE